MSMCLDLSRCTGFLHIAMQPSLSSWMTVGLICSFPIALSSARKYITSCVARPIDMYSASAEDSATVCSSFAFQLTALP
eukprot:3597771-Rhodomonas_salina.1